MRCALKINFGILIFTYALSGICIAKDAHNPASQDVILPLIQSNIGAITELSVECIIVENEGEFDTSDLSILWAIRENHNQTCGGDPDTAPVIQRVVSVFNANQKSTDLFILDADCMCLGKKLN